MSGPYATSGERPPAAGSELTAFIGLQLNIRPSFAARGMSFGFTRLQWSNVHPFTEPGFVLSIFSHASIIIDTERSPDTCEFDDRPPSFASSVYQSTK